MPDEDAQGDISADAAAAGRLEKPARALLGAASGGLMGLLVAGLIGMGKPTPEGPAVGQTLAIAAGLAALMALLNLRQKPGEKPTAPRVNLAVTLSASALLLAQVIFFFQAAHIQGLRAGGGQVQLPLSIWPVAKVALLLSAVLAGLGVLAAFLGWAELAGERGRYGGGKGVAMALLSGAAWAGLALACYAMGYGLVGTR